MSEIVGTRIDPETGHTINIYASGAEYDQTAGRLVKAPPANAITRENARAMVARKKELAQQRALEGIDEAAIEAGRIPANRAGGGEGWRAIVRHVTATLLASRNLRGQAEAANFLGKAAGLTTPDEPSAEDFAKSIALLFMPFLERLQPPPDIIEGEAREVKE